MDLTFKTASTQDTSTPTTSDFVPNESGITSNIVEDTSQTILGLIGLGDVFKSLPSSERGYIKSIGDTLDSLVEKRGLQRTTEVYNRLLGELREDMGIDRDTEPAVVLDKLGKTLTAWRDISFLRDPSERRRIFMKLARASTSRDMDTIVLDTMEKYGK